MPGSATTGPPTAFNGNLSGSFAANMNPASVGVDHTSGAPQDSNFNTVMQQIQQLRYENRELKAMMEYRGSAKKNSLSRNDHDISKMHSHLSLHSLKDISGTHQTTHPNMTHSAKSVKSGYSNRLTSN